MYTISPESVKLADRLAAEKYGIPEIRLMKTAAFHCRSNILDNSCQSDSFVIICGKGNNGGDGYALASLLAEIHYDVTVINVFDCTPVTECAKEVYESCLKDGVKVLPFEKSKEALGKATVIIDALFGVGFHGSIAFDSPIGEMLSFCNECNAKRIAIDTPSGINSADGRCEGAVFKADLTITLSYIKTGMLSYPAREFCGKIAVEPLGFPKELDEEIPKDALIPDDEYMKAILPERKKNTHKGSYGRLLMYCGNPEMTGAAVLCATSALRSGTGLLNIARDRETIKALQAHLIEPVFSVLSDKDKEKELLSLCEKASATVIGCGLGRSEGDKEILFSIIKNADCPLIIDADGINLLSENKLILREAKKTPILTPHPLEFARLVGTCAKEVQNNRINLAKKFAKDFGCVLVLKGANTVIASPDGALAINTSGNPGLAKGGSGDVLSGVIASFVAQGIDVFNSAILGVYLHGKAADNLKEKISEYGFLPSDLPMAIARLLP